MTPVDDARSYRPDIDGIRAMAVLAVLGYHAFPSVVGGGFVGVDVFFVISGYLIIGMMLRDVRAGTFSFLEFFARRIRRLAPALVITLLATLMLGLWVMLDDELHELALHTVAGAGFLSNVLLWQQSGYFAAASEATPLLHLWSLAVEWQFYVLWPLLLVLLVRRGVNATVALIALTLLSFALNVWAVSTHATAAFYLLPTRLWELLVGGLLSQWKWREERGGIRSAMGWGGLLLFAVAVAMLRAGVPFPGWPALAPTTAAMLLIAAGPEGWLNRSVLSRAPLVAVGVISYPLYLWHWPLLSFARIVEQGEPSASIRLGCLGVATLLAAVTWRIVERPIQQRLFAFRGSRLRMRWTVAALVASLVGVAAAGAAVRADAGFSGWFPRHFPERVAQLHDLAPTAAPTFPPCTGALTLPPGSDSSTWCHSADASTPARVALLGDSHTLFLFPGLAQALRARGINSLVAGHTSCAPLLGVRSYMVGSVELCEEANRRMIDGLSQMDSVQTVILSALGPFYFSDKSFAAAHMGNLNAANWRLESPDASPQRSKPALFEAGYSATIARLEAAGKQVVFLIDVPELDFHPASCIDRRPIQIGRGARTPCGVPVDVVRARQAEYRTIVTHLQQTHPRLRVFDPLPLLCDSATCSAMHDRRIVYRDSHHLSPYGAAYLAEPLVRWLDLPTPTPAN